LAVNGPIGEIAHKSCRHDRWKNAGRNGQQQNSYFHFDFVCYIKSNKLFASLTFTKLIHLNYNFISI